MSTTAVPQTHRWTRREYHGLVDAGFLGEDDPVELIGGEIIQMSPQNTPHAVAVRLVHEALRRVFPEDRYLIHDQLPLALGPDSEPEPDVSVVEGQPRDFLDEHPSSAALVVEVAEASFQSIGPGSATCTPNMPFRSTGLSTWSIGSWRGIGSP